MPAFKRFRKRFRKHKVKRRKRQLRNPSQRKRGRNLSQRNRGRNLSQRRRGRGKHPKRDACDPLKEAKTLTAIRKVLTQSNSIKIEQIEECFANMTVDMAKLLKNLLPNMFKWAQLEDNEKDRDNQKCTTAPCWGNLMISFERVVDRVIKAARTSTWPIDKGPNGIAVIGLENDEQAQLNLTLMNELMDGNNVVIPPGDVNASSTTRPNDPEPDWLFPWCTLAFCPTVPGSLATRQTSEPLNICLCTSVKGKYEKMKCNLCRWDILRRNPFSHSNWIAAVLGIGL